MKSFSQSSVLLWCMLCQYQLTWATILIIHIPHSLTLFDPLLFHLHNNECSLWWRWWCNCWKYHFRFSSSIFYKIRMLNIRVRVLQVVVREIACQSLGFLFKFIGNSGKLWDGSNCDSLQLPSLHQIRQFWNQNFALSIPHMCSVLFISPVFNSLGGRTMRF